MPVAVALPIWLLAGCDWVGLAAGAATVATVGSGDVAGVAVSGRVVFATRAESGLVVLDAASGRTLAMLAPAPGTGSVDDLALDDSLLFALDARPPGAVSVYRLDARGFPRLTGTARPVPVGPFSGVSAARGTCVVSGGTSALTLWRYGRAGVLDGPVATADLGRGQPDVVLVPDGDLAIVSTHTWGPRFGVTILAVGGAGAAPRQLGALALDGAGFTPGGTKPSGFPIVAAPIGQGLVVVAYARELGLVDVADPARPSLRSVVDVGGPAVGVATLGTRVVVVVAGRRPALVILGLDSGRVRIERRIALAPGTKPAGVALTSTTAFVAARDRGVLRIEL